MDEKELKLLEESWSAAERVNTKVLYRSAEASESKDMEVNLTLPSDISIK